MTRAPSNGTPLCSGEQYYELEKWEVAEHARARAKEVKRMQKLGGNTLLEDERAVAQKRIDKKRKEQAEEAAALRESVIENREFMRESEFLQREMANAYKMGDRATYEKLKIRLGLVREAN